MNLKRLQFTLFLNVDNSNSLLYHYYTSHGAILDIRVTRIDLVYCIHDSGIGDESQITHMGIFTLV